MYSFPLKRHIVDHLRIDFILDIFKVFEWLLINWGDTEKCNELFVLPDFYRISNEVSTKNHWSIYVLVTVLYVFNFSNNPFIPPIIEILCNMLKLLHVLFQLDFFIITVFKTKKNILFTLFWMFTTYKFKQ